MRRTKDELAKMRKAGRVVAEMHEKTRAAIRDLLSRAHTGAAPRAPRA